jgi:hypothetical protein
MPNSSALNGVAGGVCHAQKRAINPSENAQKNRPNQGPMVGKPAKLAWALPALGRGQAHAAALI